MTDTHFSNEKINHAKEMIVSFCNGNSFETINNIAKSAEIKVPDVNAICIDKSIKYLYGNESYIIAIKGIPIFRIAGDDGAYRIMTATTGDINFPDCDKEYFDDILRISEITSKLIGIEVLRLKDHLGRPFNVLFEFESINQYILHKLKELTWVFITIGLNESLFKFVESSSSLEFALNKNSSFKPATQLWGNDQLRTYSTAQDELRDIYNSLHDGEEGEDVYLMDGCWLTPDGKIVEK